MANKIVRKAKRAVRGAVRKAKRLADTVSTTMLDAKAAAAANMLMDPCNAALSEACYRGDGGYRSRFVTNTTIGVTAGNTAAAIAFIPSNNTVAVCSAASSGAATTWAVLSGPGSGFLSSTASAIRSLGACISASPVTSNLNVAGQVYTTICPVSSLQSNAVAGSAVTIDNLLSLCNKYGKVTIDAPMESKWIPGSSDEEYTTGTASLPSDVSDNNVILMCFVGFPGASGFVCRLTNIIEWKPQPFLGIVSESYLGNPSKNTIEHVKQALKAKDPNWWSNIGKGVYSVVRGYMTGGAVGAIGAAMKATKFM